MLSYERIRQTLRGMSELNVINSPLMKGYFNRNPNHQQRETTFSPHDKKGRRWNCLHRCCFYLRKVSHLSKPARVELFQRDSAFILVPALPDFAERAAKTNQQFQRKHESANYLQHSWMDPFYPRKALDFRE